MSSINQDSILMGVERHHISASEALTVQDALERSCELLSIQDMPDEVLRRILRSACWTEMDVDRRLYVNQTLFDNGRGFVNMKQVTTCSVVCKRWSTILHSSYKRATLRNVDAGLESALQVLQKYSSITDVVVSEQAFEYPVRDDDWDEYWHCPDDDEEEYVRELCGELLQSLGKRTPSLKSFHLILESEWEALQALPCFFSQQTNLQEVRLSVFEESWSKRIWQKHLKAFEAVDFSSLVNVEDLILDFKGLALPDQEIPGLFVPVSRSVVDLPGFSRLHLSLPGESFQLPHWLGELQSFASLKVCVPSGVLLKSLETMNTLKELSLKWGEYNLRPNELKFDKLAELRSLTSLNVECGKGLENLVATFSPHLKKLELQSNNLPHFMMPVPALEELLLTLKGQGVVQRDIFNFFPRLRSLHLCFGKAVVWPSMSSLTQLTSLVLEDHVEACDRTSDVNLHVEDLCALLQLRITNCGLLPSVTGLDSLGPATAVSLCCRCRCQDIYSFRSVVGSADFCTYADYVSSGSPCKHLTIDRAKQLFGGS